MNTTDFLRVPSRELPAHDLAERNRLIQAHLNVVNVIARSVHRGLPRHIEIDDLAQAGILGLIDAAKNYNSQNKVVFSYYAKHRIRGAILDSLRRNDWASRNLRLLQKRLEATARELSAKFQRTPTEAEIAAKIGVAIERLRRIKKEIYSSGPAAATARPDAHKKTTVRELAEPPAAQPDNRCVQGDMGRKLALALKALPERQQKVVLLYYVEEMTMKDIGGIFGINASRISQIHHSALVKLQRALEVNGIHSSAALLP